MINQNLDHLKDDYGDDIISKIFGEDHLVIKNFEDLKKSVEIGKVHLNFKNNSKLISTFIDNQNGSFYFAVRNLNIIIIIIFLGYSIIFNKDYYSLYLIPIFFLIRKIIFHLWYKKLLTTITLLLFTLFITSYLNYKYTTILVTFIILQSISHSAYLIFLSQYFSEHRIKFFHALDTNKISEIYDGYYNKIIKF